MAGIVDYLHQINLEISCRYVRRLDNSHGNSYVVRIKVLLCNLLTTVSTPLPPNLIEINYFFVSSFFVEFVIDNQCFCAHGTK